MLNQYPLWKNLLVVFVIVVGMFYALPNFFGQDPAIDISGVRKAVVEQTLQQKIETALSEANISVKRTELEKGRLLVRFTSTSDQQKAQTVIANALPQNYTYALSAAADVPGWLLAMGAEPMNLGLDLRGGIHVLIDVDMDAAIKDKQEAYSADVRSKLRQLKLRYLTIKPDTNAGIDIKFKDQASRDKAAEELGNEFRNLGVEARDAEAAYFVRMFLPPAEIRSIKKFALQQNITTIRNRVNALGVAEPLVQQQGDRRIVVELPGVQDPTQVKNILGATATLEYRLVDSEHDALDAKNGKVPPGSRLYTVREDGRPILLKKRVIVTGDQITDAASGFDSRDGRPMVTVNLDGKGARRMRDVTIENVGKPMAVVFKETRVVSRDAEGNPVKRMVEEVINVATIREPFGARFQTTGLDSPNEAHTLALLLRAGALAAPIDIVEERTIGPSLGQDNIDKGFMSVMLGLLAVMVFMAVYYRVFGLIANLALLANLILIVAVLSLLQATLTLPGIAGIVLTVGMAVDANVLIFERIREEISVGSTPQASIHAGYAKAFSTILDANITTFIAAVVLFSVGSGPVKGFAITLAIGILTSMFTAIVGTRAVVNKVYGHKRVAKLAI